MTEDTFTIRPPALIPGATSRQSRNVVCRLMSIPRSHSASVSSVNRRSGASTPVCTIPALLTSTSSGPASATSRAASSQDVRSATTPRTPSSAARSWMRAVVDVIVTS